MSTEEPTVASTEAEARAAFLSRVCGPALGARALLERAAELLPGAVDTASDIETALAELAAHATRRPAPAAPAAWGLDLATGALRRVAVPEPGSPVGVAAGLTWVAALESGLAQHCEALLAERLGAPGTRLPRMHLGSGAHGVPGGPGVPDALLGALRAAGRFVAHDLSGLLSLPACAVTLAPRAEPAADGGPDGGPDGAPDSAPDPAAHTVVATGATLTEAARTAVLRALSARGARAAGRPVRHAFPAIGRDREEADCRPLPAAQWSHPLDALRSQGHCPVAVLPDHDARVGEVLPYLVRIVLPAG